MSEINEKKRIVINCEKIARKMLVVTLCHPSNYVSESLLNKIKLLTNDFEEPCKRRHLKDHNDVTFSIEYIAKKKLYYDVKMNTSTTLWKDDKYIYDFFDVKPVNRLVGNRIVFRYIMFKDYPNERGPPNIYIENLDDREIKDFSTFGEIFDLCENPIFYSEIKGLKEVIIKANILKNMSIAEIIYPDIDRIFEIKDDELEQLSENFPGTFERICKIKREYGREFKIEQVFDEIIEHSQNYQLGDMRKLQYGIYYRIKSMDIDSITIIVDENLTIREFFEFYRWEILNKFGIDDYDTEDPENELVDYILSSYVTPFYENNPVSKFDLYLDDKYGTSVSELGTMKDVFDIFRGIPPVLSIGYCREDLYNPFG